MIRIADYLDVLDLGVRREMLVEGVGQLPVIHSGGEASDEDAGIMREFGEVSETGACQLGCGGGRRR